MVHSVIEASGPANYEYNETDLIYGGQYSLTMAVTLSSMTANTAPDNGNQCHPRQPILHLTVTVNVIQDSQYCT
jgi:hypothetical protein